MTVGLDQQKLQAETLQSDVDCRFLAKAGRVLGGSCVPRSSLVVGGSGMTGCNLLVLLANTPGCEKIRVLDRGPVPKAVLNDCVELREKCEYLRHDLGYDCEEDLARACVGIDCVFSTITPDVQKGTKEDFHQTNVVGVGRLLKAASAAGVPRFVFLSSIAATNHFINSDNITEAETPALATLTSPYDISKRLGEDLVIAASSNNGMVTCSLRAGGILLSPNDYAFRNYFMVPGVMFNITTDTEVDFIAGEDVARGMILAVKALESRPADTAGEIFFLTKGESCNPGPMLATTAEILGWPVVMLPEFIFEVACFFVWLANATKFMLGFSTPGVPPHKFWKMARVRQTFDNSKARDVLGYAAEVTIRDAIRHITACHVRNMQNRGTRPMTWLGWISIFFEPWFWLIVLTLGGLRVAF